MNPIDRRSLANGTLAIVCSTAGALLSPALADHCPPQWDNTLGTPGLAGTVWDFAVYDGELVAGGGFTGLVRRFNEDTGTWQTLGGGLSAGFNPRVHALAVYDGDLYAAGHFLNAEGVTANRIARWDGSNWHPLGSGVNDMVWDLTVWDGHLIVAGQFTNAGGISGTSRIARWNGTSWQGLGGGTLNNFVRGVDVYQGDLILAGLFTSATGAPNLNRIARWNGSSFSAIGSGFDNSHVWTVIEYEGDLFAGGFFTEAGGVTVNRVARWDGTTWQSMGTGMNESVQAFAIFDGDLIASGNFTNADGLTLPRIARWNHTDGWQGLDPACPASVGGGCGMSGFVHALFADDGRLLAGGSFTTAFGMSTNRVASLEAQHGAGSADLNCDGSVGVSDLLILLSQWGPCADCGDCPADLSSDCSVGVNDLLILLANWQ